MTAVPYQTQTNDPQVRGALKRLGAELRRGRWRAGLSQCAVEERTGIDQSTISRLENGLASRLPIERVGLYLLAIHAELEAGPRRRPSLMPSWASGGRSGDGEANVESAPTR